LSHEWARLAVIECYFWRPLSNGVSTASLRVHREQSGYHRPVADIAAAPVQQAAD